jgi:hypothetical protein
VEQRSLGRVNLPLVATDLGRADFLTLLGDGRGRAVPRVRGGRLLAIPRLRILFVVRPGARSRRVALSKLPRDALRLWRRWSHGAIEVATRFALPPPRRERLIGDLATIGYTWYGRGAGTEGERRYHPFEWPLPRVYDAGSVLAIRGGRWRLTARGIVG